MSESSEGAASDPYLSPAPSGVYRMRSVTSGPLLALSTRRSLLQCRPHTIQHETASRAPRHCAVACAQALWSVAWHAPPPYACTGISALRVRERLSLVCARVAAVRALEHLYVVVLDERRAQDELEPRIAQHTRHDMR